jgi:hypothetical protein
MRTQIEELLIVTDTRYKSHAPNQPHEQVMTRWVV